MGKVINKNREQKLIDIIFQIAQHSALYFTGESLTPEKQTLYYNQRENHMEWVADQLRKNGFDTEPMGMSWGVLKNNDNL